MFKIVLSEYMCISVLTVATPMISCTCTCRWFCHFDDDIYVNTPALSKLLKQYNSQDSIYLGRFSSSRKTRIPVSSEWLPQDGNVMVYACFLCLVLLEILFLWPLDTSLSLNMLLSFLICIFAD